jgi:5-methylcytosine-specific restriction enzyme B
MACQAPLLVGCPLVEHGLFVIELLAMAQYDLRTDDGLRAACDAIGRSNTWGEGRPEWMDLLSETIRSVRSADQSQRATREFQERLWERNHVAAIGQGNIPVGRALDDEGFRKWLAQRSMEPLPAAPAERLRFLTSLYDDMKQRLKPFLDQKTPHLKMFRVMAALYPEGMTTVASAGALHELTRAMGSDRRLELVERHVWTRERLDGVLGPLSGDVRELAERISLPWMLYERFVKPPAEPVEPPQSETNDARLEPLPAARRRRGLSAIRGSFPAVLSTLEFARDGVTRADLLGFLKAESPEAKESTLAVTINCLQSELAVIRTQGNLYVLTKRGEDVLESQDPTHLADWLLTRILGPDKALVELRDRGTLSPTVLVAAIRPMNPGWTTDFAPQVIVSWLRSMGVIETTPDYKHRLTELGARWAAKISWTPEPLPAEVMPIPPAPETGAKPTPAMVLPDLPAIVAAVQKDGHFPGPLIAQLHAGLWSHPRRHFAILTGLSGAGKTLLARSYGRALTNVTTEARLFTLPVQPGWYDPGAILGYPNPLDKTSYVRPPVLAFLMRASGDATHPYVLVLDEMNLSHPEQYFAPLLSAMETGDEIILHTEDERLDGVDPTLPYPGNLVIIGTVNMDETTHGLSDKVLDRAFVLEFWQVDLGAYPKWGKRSLPVALESEARKVLDALMKALSPARMHFGWRVVDDVLDFLERSTVAGGLAPTDALDAVVYAKILPKLRGEDAPRFREALKKCEEALSAASLTRSRDKVAELRNDVETTGSARFWR